MDGNYMPGSVAGAGVMRVYQATVQGSHSLTRKQTDKQINNQTGMNGGIKEHSPSLEITHRLIFLHYKWKREEVIGNVIMDQMRENLVCRAKDLNFNIKVLYFMFKIGQF